LVVGLWLGFRVVNLPSFADFLIAVEAEMNKVSWPSRTELIRASLVVIVLMFGLTIVLFTYDVVLTSLLKAIGVVT
jgi:preprotein translocase subunit SecE